MLKNPGAQDIVQVVEVAAGEHRLVEIDRMVPLPAVARFERVMNGACRVSLDGSDRGLLAAMDYRLEVPAPDLSHSLAIACPGAAARTVALAPMSPGKVFAVEAAPGEALAAAALPAGTP